VTVVTRPAPPEAADAASLSALRDALRRADYDAERVEAELGTHELSSRPLDTAVHLRRLRDDAFSTLARLFLLGAEVDAERLAEATAPVEVAWLGRSGLPATGGAGARACVRAEWLFSRVTWTRRQYFGVQLAETARSSWV